MSKLPLTIEMADTIRELRLQNKIASKDITLALGRSPSYISKIESGYIKSISEEEFDIILSMILPECTSAQERLDKLIEYQVKRYGFDSREDWAWFQNLDTVYRLIPIPTELVSEINSMLKEDAITLDCLVERINGNEELCEEDRNNENLPYNEWFERSDSDSRMSIKMFLKREDVENILNGEIKACNYVTMQAIVHYLFKIKMYPENHSFTTAELKLIQREWLPLLDKHKFFTLSRKEMLLSQTNSKNQAKSILNEFDVENQEILNRLLKFIKMATDMDILSTNKALKQFVSNLDWDYNFMLRVIGFNFASIEGCSFSNKLQMLKEIRDIVTKYQEMPKEQKIAETYGDLD